MADLNTNSMGITAIVVTRGMEGLLRFCIYHLHQALQCIPASGHRIVVVDNASPFPVQVTDLNYPELALVRFDTHNSFADANNTAAGQYPNAFYLLLNNDVLLETNAVKRMIRLVRSTPNAGISSTRMVFPDGTLQHCGVVFGCGKTGPYHYKRGSPSHVVPRTDAEFQAVTGACMLIARDIWDELNGLDGGYPFGLEDIDFCLRARQRGYRILCDNRKESLHFEAATPGRSKLDIPSRRLFMQHWAGHYMIDG